MMYQQKVSFFSEITQLPLAHRNIKNLCTKRLIYMRHAYFYLDLARGVLHLCKFLPRIVTNY